MPTILPDMHTKPGDGEPEFTGMPQHSMIGSVPRKQSKASRVRAVVRDMARLDRLILEQPAQIMRCSGTA